MKLKRTDLDQNLCSPPFGDTYLSPNLFQYLPSVKNITIYYNCITSNFLPKQSLCGSQIYAICHADDEEKFMEESRGCSTHIQVPIGADFYVEKDVYGYFKRDVLESGLHKGFEVKYSVNEECLSCLGNDERDLVVERQTNCSSYNKHVDLCYYDDCPDGSIASSTHCSSLHKSMYSYLFISYIIIKISYYDKLKTIGQVLFFIYLYSFVENTNFLDLFKTLLNFVMNLSR